MKKLVLETTAPFQGLPELVAYDEGLFEKEGLAVEWADREKGVEKKVEHHDHRARRASIPSPAMASCSSRARRTCTTPANGEITAVCGSTSAGSRQLGRRAIVCLRGHGGRAGFTGLHARSNSPTAMIGVPFYFGTHYIALHMLEGFLPRDEIKLCRAPNGSRYRLDALMRGEIDATTLTEPHITLAEKKGCRTICSAFFHGTEVASDRVDAETYAAFNRAVREAVRRINADKRAYLHYFIDYHAKTDPEVAALKVEDLREGTACRGATRRRFRWTRCSAPTSGSRAGTCWRKPPRPLQLVNMEVQSYAHQAAE